MLNCFIHSRLMHTMPVFLLYEYCLGHTSVKEATLCEAAEASLEINTNPRDAGSPDGPRLCCLVWLAAAGYLPGQ